MVITLSKIVRKWRPVDYWQIGENESWFQDMAREGLHLKSMGYTMAKFEREEPKKTRYRIDIYQGEYANKEQKKFYTENGWDFVTNYGEFNIYSSPEDVNSPELHSDPLEQAHTLKTLEDKMNGLLFLNVIGPVSILAFLFFILFNESTPALAILDYFTMQTIGFLIIGSRGFYQFTKSYLDIRNLRRNLLNGKTIDHNAPWENSNRKSKINSRILTGLALFSIIFPLVSVLKSETKTLPETTANLPIVRLSDIEQNPNLIREISYIDEEVDYGNFYSYDWNILAPIQYRSNESGIVPNVIKDDGKPYDPYIVSNTYKLVFNNMSKGVFKGLIKKAKNCSSSENFTQIKNDKFEDLVIYQHERFTEVFAYKGKGVIRVRYFGQADVENIIQAIENKIELIGQ